MKQLSAIVDRISQADRKFFERRPDRQYRVRPAAMAEIEQFMVFDGFDDPRPPAGYAHYIVVRNLAPGVRIRVPFTTYAGNDCDVSEDMARWIYDTYATNTAREIEAAYYKHHPERMQ